FDNADAESRWVLNGDDGAVLALAGDAPGERYLFFLDDPRGRSWDADSVPEGRAPGRGPIRGRGYVREGVLTLDVSGREEPLVAWDEVPLLGRHNVANALAAALAARVIGVDVPVLRRGLRTAASLPHRLEPVGEVGDVLWVNDSKATNVAAAVSAVRSLEGRTLLLLLGGKDKGEDLAPLVVLLAGAPAGRLRAVLCYGAAGERIAGALERGGVPAELLGSDFEAVVARAAELARSGDVVLLAPACSSFDMFEDYEARGDAFRRLVRARAA
ncbi:MAG: cyanophycin synthetase, partial [Gemmatimonadota bacterium]